MSDRSELSKWTQIEKLRLCVQAFNELIDELYDENEHLKKEMARMSAKVNGQVLDKKASEKLAKDLRELSE